ncbi:MAG: helix-hairpin-helix domain-containing protein [Candidatus Omnitrophica bacterium]|nr:helix-hairpin-helix domain-containing protein [Candidatus Omnitrophota bacterium]
MTALAREARRHLAWLAIAGLIGLGLSPHPRSSDQPVASSQHGGAAWDRALHEARQVDLNAADAATLERLPGIGPSLARRIVAHREARGGFRHPDELLDVPGIGPNTYEALSTYVTTE